MDFPEAAISRHIPLKLFARAVARASGRVHLCLLGQKKKANVVLEQIALAIHLPQIQPVIVFNLQLEPLIKV